MIHILVVLVSLLVFTGAASAADGTATPAPTATPVIWPTPTLRPDGSAPRFVPISFPSTAPSSDVPFGFGAFSQENVMSLVVYLAVAGVAWSGWIQAKHGWALVTTQGIFMAMMILMLVTGKLKQWQGGSSGSRRNDHDNDKESPKEVGANLRTMDQREATGD